MAKQIDNTSRKFQTAQQISYFMLMLLLLTGCGQPTSVDPEYTFHTPEDVVVNMRTAYEERDLERYLSSFAPHSTFLDGETLLWDFESERRIHSRMFAEVTALELDMHSLGSETQSDSSLLLAYRYRVTAQLASAPPMTAEGEVILEFMSNNEDSWQITSFHDRTGGLNKVSNRVLMPQDSVDYFPLRVGNSWTYDEQFAPGTPDFEVLITDSLILKGNLYYQLQNGQCITAYSNFIRVDSLRQLRMFFTCDSSEHAVFDLAAEVGDSLSFIPPGATGTVVVELCSQRDSLAVPAGTFPDVLEFVITDNNSGASLVYQFAANVGIIRQSATNQRLALKSAFVNGETYPVITSVEPSYTSWTQIKSNFR
ncbi:hypothetical protein IH879_20090 [candidate division KSB1 bacterium]|nr:hypothetical protein [candidate division KSB1 bacterium]